MGSSATPAVSTPVLDGISSARDPEGSVVAAEIPARQLAEDAPIYHREAKQPDWEIRNAKFEIGSIIETLQGEYPVFEWIARWSEKVRQWWSFAKPHPDPPTPCVGTRRGAGSQASDTSGF